MSALWNNALDLYRQTTGEDWRMPDSKFYDLYLNLEMCDSDESSILQALDVEVQKFEAYSHGSEKVAKLRAIVLPITQCFLALIEVGGEAGAARVRP